MTEIQATDVILAATVAADDDAAPRKSVWQRFEPTVLGTGTIVLLLLVWQFLPDFVPMKAGTKLFFTVPSHIAGTLWTMFATGSDLGAARRQRLSFRDRSFARHRRRLAARRAARPLADAQCHDRSVHHRVQRHAAARLPAALDAVVRHRHLVEGRRGLPRRLVPAFDQHLRGRAQRRQASDQRGALVRRQRMGYCAPRRGAEFPAFHHRRLAARHRPRRARRRGGRNSSAPRTVSVS